MNTERQDEKLKTPIAASSDITLPVIRDIHHKVFLLDIDGVVCDAQQPVSEEMCWKLNHLSMFNLLYFVTGNNYTKSVDLLEHVVHDGVFCNNADEFRSRRGKLIWTEAGIHPLPPWIENTLQWLLSNDYKHYGNRIEWRTPRMVNFSHCGRYATKEQREVADVSWREDTVNLIKTIYPEVDVAIGGKVSIDISSHGADKSRAGLYLNQFLGRDFVFIGDKTQPGGNDYPLVEYCGKHTQNIALTSYGPDYTLMLLDKILKQVG